MKKALVTMRHSFSSGSAIESRVRGGDFAHYRRLLKGPMIQTIIAGVT
jgi:hypothetical protein